MREASEEEEEEEGVPEAAVFLRRLSSIIDPVSSSPWFSGD